MGAGLPGGTTRIPIRVQPRASRNAIVIDDNHRIRVAITDPPVDDAANTAVCRLIAKRLGISSRNVCLVKGARSREKVVEVTGLQPEAVQARLEGGLANQP